MSEVSPVDPWSVARIEALAPDGKSVTAARELLQRPGDATEPSFGRAPLVSVNHP